MVHSRHTKVQHYYVTYSINILLLNNITEGVFTSKLHFFNKGDHKAGNSHDSEIEEEESIPDEDESMDALEEEEEEADEVDVILTH